MKGLLDTHVFIWFDGEPSKLSPAAVAFLQSAGNTILLTVASAWIAFWSPRRMLKEPY